MGAARPRGPMTSGEGAPPAHPEYPTAPRGLVWLVVAGMALIALGTVEFSLGLLLIGLVVFIGAFGFLIATTPEPTREVMGADGKLHPVPDRRTASSGSRQPLPSSPLQSGRAH